MFFDRKKLEESHQKYKEKTQKEENEKEQKRKEWVNNLTNGQFEEFAKNQAQQCFVRMEEYYEFYGTFKGFDCKGTIKVDITNNELKQLKKKFPQHNIKLTKICYNGCRAGCLEEGPAIQYSIPENYFQFKD